MTAAELVRHVLIDDLHVASGRAEDTALRLRADLGLDALDFLELTLALENDHGVFLTTAELRSLHTIGDLHAYVQRYVQ